MAEKPKRKRKRVASNNTAQKDALSSEERSCSEACEDELFNFKNKRSSLADLEEETMKQVQEELYEDCRYEDIVDETDRRKWKRKADYKAWNVLDKPFDTNARYVTHIIILSPATNYSLLSANWILLAKSCVLVRLEGVKFRNFRGQLIFADCIISVNLEQNLLQKIIFRGNFLQIQLEKFKRIKQLALLLLKDTAKRHKLKTF